MLLSARRLIPFLFLSSLGWGSSIFNPGTGTGGGGGSSSLQVTNAGVQVTSPTASINLVSPLNATAIGTTSQITLTMISSGIAFGSASNTLTQDTNTFTWDNTQKELIISGNALSVFSSSQAVNMGGAGFGVVYQGYAYITAVNGNSLTVFDITDPSAPKMVSQIHQTGVGPLFGAEGLEVSNGYLYVTSLSNNSLTVYSLASPANPIQVGNITDSNNLSKAEHIRIYGNYAYIADFGSDGTVPGITVVDISVATNPFVVSTLTNANIVAPIYLQLRYPYLFETNESNTVPRANIIDISTPTRPSLISTIVPTGASHSLTSSDLWGRYWYICGFGDHQIFTVDVSSPFAPVSLSSVTTGTTGPDTVKVLGNTIYASNQSGNNVEKFSLVNPSTPSLVGTVTDAVNLAGPDDFFVNGRFLYVTIHGGTGGFTILNTGSQYVDGIQGGSAQFNDLDVNHDIRANRIFSDSMIRTNILGVNNMISGGAWSGGGLSTPCGDTSHGLAISTTTGQFFCQSITGTASAPGGASGNIQYNNATNFGGISYLNTASNNGLTDTGFSGLTISSGSTSLQTGHPLSVTWASAGTSPYTYIPITLSGSTGGSAFETGLDLNLTGTGASNPIQLSSMAVECAGSGRECTAAYFNAHGGTPNIALKVGTGNVQLSGLSASQFVQTDASKNLVSFDLFNASPTYTGQASWTSPSPSTFTYQVNVGSITGGGLATCGDSTHGLGYSGSNQFTCQTITGSGGGGGASTLEILAGVNRTSPTVTVGFPVPAFTGTVTGSSMTVGLDGSSVTMRGANWSNVVDASTASLTTRIIAVGVSTAAIAVDTGTLTTRIIAVGISTAAIAVDTGTINTIVSGHTTRLIAVGISTAAIAVDTGTINTALSTKVNYSSFSATLPVTFNSANGTIGATQISLSTGVMNILPSTLLVSTVAYLTSTQTFSGQNNWITTLPSSFTYAVNVGSITGGGLATCGDTTHALIYTSTNTFACQSITGTGGGSGGLVSLSTGVFQTLPTNLMVSTVAYLSSTQTWTAGQTFSSATANSLVVVTSAVIPSLSQNFGRATLNQWFSQMASLQTPFSPLNANKLSIVILGDSHMAKNVETGPFIDWLYSNFGNGGTYFPLSDNGESDNTMRPNGCTYSRTGSWVTNQNSPTALGLDDDSMHSSTPTATILGTCPQADTVILHYTKQPNGGTVDFSVDGANHMVLNTANGSTIVASATISGLAYGVHTASVSLVSPSGTAGIDVLDWVFFSSSTPGAVVYRAGSNAQRADMYVAQNATQYQNLIAMLPSTPSVVMVALDINDAASSVVPATFVSNVETIVQRFRNVYPNIDCSYQSEPDASGSSAYLFPLKSYENALLQASVNDNCSFTDFTAYFSTYPQFSQYYSDTIHLNAQGGQVAAQLFINTFSNNVNTITPFTYNASSNVVTWGTDVTTAALRNFNSLGTNIQVSSGITNSGAIGTNLKVSSSNVFLIGGLPGSGADQDLLVSSITSTSISNTYGISAGTYTGAGLSTCGDSTHALAWNNGVYSCQSIAAGTVINPGFLMVQHGAPLFQVNTSSYIAIGNSFMALLSTTEVEAQIPFHSSGTLRGFWIQIKTNSLTQAATCYVRINGQNAAESIVIPPGVIGELTDNANVDPVNLNDKVDFLVKTSGGSGILNFIGMSIVFQANANNVMKMVGTGNPTNTITSGLTTFYTPIAGNLDTSSQFESTTSYKIKTSGTFSSMGIYVSTNTRPDTMTIRFRKNNANGNQVITVGPNSTGLFEDTTHTDSVVIGDTVTYAIVGGGNASGNPFIINWIGSEFTTTGNSMEYSANTVAHSFAAGDTNFYPIQGFGGTDNAEINDMQVKSQIGMQCSNMHIYLTTNTINQPTTVVFRKNQADGLQKIIIPAGSWGYFEDAISSHTDFISPGDEADWKETTPAGSGTAPFAYIGMTCRYSSTLQSPGGSDTQVIFADKEAEAGSSLFTFNKSSGGVAVTYGVTAGSFTSTGLGNTFINGTLAQDLNTAGGVVDIYKTNASAGDLLLNIGSNQQVNQFQVKDQTPLSLQVFGANIGNLQIGLASHLSEIYSNQAAAGQQEINIWNGGEMDIQSANSGNAGKDIVMKPQTIESARFSNTSGMVVASSETITSSSGLSLRAGPLNILSQAAPTLTNGNLWQDSTQSSMKMMVVGTTQSINGTLWTMTVSSSIFNTATETSVISTATTTGVGTLALPANFFTAGKTLYLVLIGTYTTTGTPTLDIKVKIGTMTVLDSGVVTQTAVTGTDAFTLSTYVTCRTAGATGTLMSAGQTVQNTSTIATAGMDLNSTITNGVNTTGYQTFSVTVTWGAASASNNLTFTNGFLKVLN